MNIYKVRTLYFDQSVKIIQRPINQFDSQKLRFAKINPRQKSRGYQFPKINTREGTINAP